MVDNIKYSFVVPRRSVEDKKEGEGIMLYLYKNTPQWRYK